MSPSQPNLQHCELQRACLVSTAWDRQGAIDDILSRFGDAGPDIEQNHDYLRRLVSKLDGLPPSALDPLKRLAEAPRALAAFMAGAGTDEIRAAIWRLETDLPFLWCTTPLAAWDDGFKRQRTNLTRTLEERDLPHEMAAGIADTSVAAAARNLADLDPGLRVVMMFCGFVDPPRGIPPSIFQAAQARISRTDIDEHDLREAAFNSDSSRASCFRSGALAKMLPNFNAFSPVHWESLDASCACALAAANQATLTHEQLIAARNVRAEDPISFNDLYAASLTMLARGKPLVCAL